MAHMAHGLAELRKSRYRRYTSNPEEAGILPSYCFSVPSCPNPQNITPLPHTPLPFRKPWHRKHLPRTPDPQSIPKAPNYSLRTIPIYHPFPTTNPLNFHHRPPSHLRAATTPLSHIPKPDPEIANLERMSIHHIQRLSLLPRSAEFSHSKLYEFFGRET